METRKCPFCGGTMIRAKSNLEGHAVYFWRAPWKKGLKAAFSGAIRAYPWLCIDCGVIIPYVDEITLQKIREEYEQAKLEGLI
ncbi:hypothetical protein [Thermococcus sp.]